MRIFYAFLIVLTFAILLLLPVSDGIHDYRTDVREDDYATVTTGAGESSANVVLVKPLYDDDISVVTILSDTTSDTPSASSYTTATRSLTVAGLSANTTRELTVEYEVDSLTGGSAIDTIVARLDLIWLIALIAFPAAALAAVFLGRA